MSFLFCCVVRKRDRAVGLDEHLLVRHERLESKRLRLVELHIFIRVPELSFSLNLKTNAFTYVLECDYTVYITDNFRYHASAGELVHGFL